MRNQEEYDQKFIEMLERGVQVDDVLICDEGARPKPHYHTKKLHVRVLPRSIIDDTGPRFLFTVIGRVLSPMFQVLFRIQTTLK